jgi:hypothetical protein
MFFSITRSLHWLLAITLLATVGATFYFSLNHPITADLAMLHYSAWLINEKNFVLYRDIFDINFPAPYLFHSILGNALGYEALPLRWVDLVLLASARLCQLENYFSSIKTCRNYRLQPFLFTVLGQRRRVRFRA